MRCVLLPALVALTCLPVQAQVTVNSYVDKTVLGDAETLAYTLELAGDLSHVGDVQAPDAVGLTLSQGTPVLRSQMTTSNGSDHLTIRWLYRPQRVGHGEILAARIPLGGRTITTDPIEIEIVPQSQRGGARQSRIPGAVTPDTLDVVADGDLFIRGVPSASEVVVGQQILLDYNLYFRPGVRPRDSEIVGSLNADGFWREKLEVPAQARVPRMVTVGNEEFYAVTLMRMALFPTRSGSLRVSELTINTQLVGSGRVADPFDSFFSPFSNRLSTEELTAPAVEFDVDDLPPNPPESFSGSVGRFGMAAFLDREEVEAGNPVELVVEITGDGNIATLSPPELTLPDSFELYGPTEDRTINNPSGPISGSKLFTFTLIPQRGDTYAIGPIEWTFYNPELETYESLQSSSFELEVSGSASSVANVPADPSTPLGVISNTSWTRTRPSRLIPTPLLFGGFAVPLLALLGLVAVRKIRSASSSTTPEALALRAHPEARKKLKESRKALGNPAVVFASVERALRTFLSERLSIPAMGTSHSVLTHTLVKCGVSKDTAQEVADLLKTCENGRYAPFQADASAAQKEQDELVARAQNLLVRIDEEAKPVISGA
ncbi:MAG: BatD family protein [Rubricoccaceae bacterium]|nr:BatD family protein [Rubricoccaceae bacterium]